MRHLTLLNRLRRLEVTRRSRPFPLRISYRRFDADEADVIAATAGGIRVERTPGETVDALVNRTFEKCKRRNIVICDYANAESSPLWGRQRATMVGREERPPGAPRP